MSQQEEILKIVRMNGPLLPSKVAKAIGTNIIFASAMLSEMVGSKKVKISNTKIDGSPVYYLQGQEHKLQELYEHINNKDKQAFDILKEKKVVNDAELDSLTRVSMRALKDFAIPLNVQNNGQKFLFWKWYMVENKEAEEIIRSKIQPAKEENVKNEEKEKEYASKLEEQEKEAEQKRQEEERKLEEERIRFQQEKKLKAEREEIEKQRQEIARQRKELENERKESATQKTLENENKPEENELNDESTEEKDKNKEKKKPDPSQDEFFNQVNEFFRQKEIEILETTIIRKNSEIEFLVRVPSVVGKLDYYCKAKNKKRISDSDLSSAFVQGQLKKLPSMMLVTGDMTKKAKSLLDTELAKNLVVKRI